MSNPPHWCFVHFTMIAAERKGLTPDADMIGRLTCLMPPVRVRFG
jgi:hypothetical protein